MTSSVSPRQTLTGRRGLRRWQARAYLSGPLTCAITSAPHWFNQSPIPNWYRCVTRTLLALGSSLARRKHEALLERHRKFKTGCGVRGIFLEDVPLARVSQASVRRYTGPSGEDFAVGGRTALYTSRPDINLCPRLRTRRVKGRKTSCRNRVRAISIPGGSRDGF